MMGIYVSFGRMARWHCHSTDPWLTGRLRRGVAGRHFPLSLNWIVSALLVVVASDGCNRTSATFPTDLNCGRGPIVVPAQSALRPCEPATPMCPAARPAGARTLVALSVCDYPSGSAAPPASDCRVTICPVIPAEGLDVGFTIGPNDTSACVTSLSVHLQATSSGGVEYRWVLDEKAPKFDVGGCNIIQSTNGSGAVSGPCCGAQVSVPAMSVGHTVRIDIQSDWAR